MQLKLLHIQHKRAMKVTEERYVTMVNGRIETPHAWSVKELERDELELMEKRKFLQQRGFCLLQYDGTFYTLNIIHPVRPFYVFLPFPSSSSVATKETLSIASASKSSSESSNSAINSLYSN